jgi:hypothetical protein
MPYEDEKTHSLEVRKLIALECRKLANNGELEARLRAIDATDQKQRIFILGCGRSGTWLLTGIMSTFRDVAIIPAEVPVKLFGLMTSSKPIQVMKRSMRSFESVERIPPRISILYIVRHPFDVLTSFNKTTRRKYHISPARWLGEIMALQFLVNTQRPATKIVRYEDLVEDPLRVQGQIADFFGLARDVDANQFLNTFHPPPEATAAMHGLRPIDCRSVGRWKSANENIDYLRSIRPRLGGMLDWVGNKFDYDIALPAELQAV